MLRAHSSGKTWQTDETTDLESTLNIPKIKISFTITKKFTWVACQILVHIPQLYTEY